MRTSISSSLRGSGTCGSGSKWPRLPSQSSSSICPRGICKGPRQSGKQPQQHSLSLTAAAAAAEAFGPAEELQGIVPYVNHRASQLKGRSIAANPAQGAWQAAAKLALRAELLLAAAVDKHKLAPYAMSAAAGLLLGLGLDALSLVQHGMPAYLADLLLCNFNVWDPALWTLALTAAALPVTLWALRAWWRANIHLLAQPAAALQGLAQQQQGVTQQEQQQLDQAEGRAMQQQGQEQGSRYLGAGLAAALAVLRCVCLSSAANSFMTVLYTRGLSSTAAAVSTGVGAVSLAAAVALLLLQHGANHTTSSSSSSKVLVSLLAAEAAWLAAVVGVSPLVSAAAAAVLCGSLYLLHTSIVLPALQQYKSAAGDTVEVHVGLKLAGTQPVFDSTLNEAPIRVQVKPVVPADVTQLWANAVSASVVDDSAQQEAADADSSSSSSSEGAPLMPDQPLSSVQRDIQQWMQQPMARWEALKPFVAQAAEGLYLGETASVPLYNPSAVGYWNPRFTWWQPIAEVEAKFGGELPRVGDVFWYPVADGAAVPTRVNAIGKDFVELDANYGVADTQLELQVQLVRLDKPA